MAVIDSKKLLPSGKPGGSIVNAQKAFLVPVSNIVYKKDINISQKLLKPADRETQKPGGSLVVVKKKVLQIKDVINNTYLIQQSENNRKRKEKERQKAEDREKKLETKPEKKIDFNNLSKISLPGKSILDTINRFLTFTFVGFLFDKYNQYLPKLLEFVKYIEPVTKFIDSFTKNAVDGIIKFIDLGYQAYDNVHKTIENIGGKNAAKTFDEFSSGFNKLLNGAIMASMLIASTAPRSPRGISGGASAGVTGAAKTGSDILERGALSRVNESFGRYIAGEANIGDRARLLRRGYIGGRQALTRGGTEALEEGAARKTAQAVATQATKQSLRSVAAVPIIGALIGFIVDTVVFHEKPTRAAAGAVGSALGQGLGIVLAGGTTFGLGAGVGMFVGGFVGDWLGKALYDTITKTNQVPTQARAQGGQVNSKQSNVTPTRQIKVQRTPRKQSYIPPKTQPGRDIGGKLKIEELYGKDEPGKRSALRALKKSSSDLKGMRSMNGVAGGMLGAGIDIALGQKPDKRLADSLGSMFGSVVQAAIDSELNSSFNDITRTIAMANGGVVPSREIGSGMSVGEKISNYISSAFRIALEGSAAKVLRNLNQELNLEGGPAGSPDVGGPMGPIEYGPLPLNMTQKQAFATIYELSKKHNAAMPELVAAMAMNESGYLSSLLARQYNNPFGQTGVGTKGSTRIPGNSRTFAVYNNLSDAIKFHVEKWNNDSSYGKGAGTYANAVEGLKAILPTYDPGGDHPQYLKNVASILSTMGFDPQKKNPAVNLSTSALIQQRKSTPPAMVTGGIKPSQVPQTSGFGPRILNGRKENHPGIDLDAGDGTPISSAQDATVIWAGNKNDGYGNSVVLRYSNGAEARFGHFKSINVTKGKTIKAGQLLGKQGSTGEVTGSHLHFEYFPDGNAMSYKGSVNPESIKDNFIRFGGDIKPIQQKVSLAPTPSSTNNLLASVQQNPSYSQGGSMIIHDVNNIVMPVMVG